MPIQIEKNVSLPGKQNRRGKWKNVIQKMSKGDSFLIPLKYKNKLGNTIAAIRKAAQNLGYKVLSRKVENNLVRVWRIK